MNYGSIKVCDCANGPGMRTSLFVSGCSHHCKGCFNEVTWDYDYGKEFLLSDIDYILETVENPQCRGLSILGGEPLDTKNQKDVWLMVQSFRYHFDNNKDIWIYTGYTWETIPQTKYTSWILECTDVLVDGPFIESEKDITLNFRGSRNQRIIDVKKSLEKLEVVLLEEYM